MCMPCAPLATRPPDVLSEGELWRIGSPRVTRKIRLPLPSASARDLDVLQAPGTRLSSCARRRGRKTKRARKKAQWKPEEAIISSEGRLCSRRGREGAEKSLPWVNSTMRVRQRMVARLSEVQRGPHFAAKASRAILTFRLESMFRWEAKDAPSPHSPPLLLPLTRSLLLLRSAHAAAAAAGGPPARPARRRHSSPA